MQQRQYRQQDRSRAMTRLGPASISPEMPMGMSEGKILKGRQTNRAHAQVCSNLDDCPCAPYYPNLEKVKRDKK
ncbi:hypothetical protein COCMIDRAFT_32720 [Bipolaris oryzae ATCC 44560]|uniref:Uncharacterized protein n=2 Tax=Bipolaris TaxID=33194 RepID=W7A1M2_COCMI|nr:uncharacterized protein COCMIDRAFT_32720 [Bipolaris oryzae ATCC 44560]XP_014553164.1 hypothetical protein COCVIDRAFT_108437 [Bipolaris victoriae FI3]EUC49926.1 hypothetical protein COCMIDRAFT_32720 [Bipolaris oryzae ATCC 44560]